MSRPLVLWWWERYRARSNTALTRHCLVMRSRVQVEKGRPLGARQLVCTAWKAWIWRGQKDFALYDQVIEYIFGSQIARSIGHFRVPKTLTLKMRLGAQPFQCENEFYLHENEKWFPYQRLSTYPRFETEAQGNSEMAYYILYLTSTKRASKLCS